MLNEKDWQIAKKIVSIANQGDEPKNPKTIIILLSKLLSCQNWYTYTLIPKRTNTSGTTYLRAVKVIIGRTEEEVCVRPTEVSSQRLKTQLQNGGGNAFPRLLEESKQSGSACKVLSWRDTVYAYTVIQHDRPPLKPLQLLLKFMPTANLDHQKTLLLETLLPSIASCLYNHFFPMQPESPLTRRERQILRMIAEGSNISQVANKLDISPRTVNFHLGGAYRKLSARNRQEALCVAQKAGLIGSGGLTTGRSLRGLHEEELHDIGGGFRRSPQSILTTTPIAVAWRLASHYYGFM